jgi:hypothetical protein
LQRDTINSPVISWQLSVSPPPSLIGLIESRA